MVCFAIRVTMASVCQFLIDIYTDWYVLAIWHIFVNVAVIVLCVLRPNEDVISLGWGCDVDCQGMSNKWHIYVYVDPVWLIPLLTVSFEKSAIGWEYRYSMYLGRIRLWSSKMLKRFWCYGFTWRPDPATELLINQSKCTFIKEKKSQIVLQSTYVL